MQCFTLISCVEFFTLTRAELQCDIDVVCAVMCCDDNASSGEKVTDAAGDAAESDDVMTSDAVKDTYVDTLNLWVCSVIFLYCS